MLHKFNENMSLKSQGDTICFLLRFIHVREKNQNMFY